MSFNPLESIQRYRSEAISGRSLPKSPMNAGRSISLNDLHTRSEAQSRFPAKHQASPKLAMSQRRFGEQMEIRLELEAEVDRLKKTVARLKKEKKEAESQIEAVTDRANIQKAKSDATIRELRSQLAITKSAQEGGHRNPKTRHDGMGNYASSVNQAISPAKFPPRESSSKEGLSHRSTSQLSRAMLDENVLNEDGANDNYDKALSGFQNPTFSELMRISAKEVGNPDHPSVFDTSLRKYKPVNWDEKLDVLRTVGMPTASGSPVGSVSYSPDQIMHSYRYTEKYDDDIAVIEIDLSKVTE